MKLAFHTEHQRRPPAPPPNTCICSVKFHRSYANAEWICPLLLIIGTLWQCSTKLQCFFLKHQIAVFIGVAGIFHFWALLAPFRPPCREAAPSNTAMGSEERPKLPSGFGRKRIVCALSEHYQSDWLQMLYYSLHTTICT